MRYYNFGTNYINQKLILLVFPIFIYSIALGQSLWVRKADFWKPKIFAASFSIGNKGYVVTGSADGEYTNDMWEYDTANKWTRSVDYPAKGRRGAVGFSVGDKGYVCFGYSGLSQFHTDLYEFDPKTRNWLKKKNCPGYPRDRAVSFVIGYKAYVGLGQYGTTTWNDFWEYNPSSDSWKQIADFPGIPRSGAIGFSIGNKGYVGTGGGFQLGSDTNDLWEYDPVKNSWTKKADLPGKTRRHAIGFSAKNRGYIYGGENWYYMVQKDLWEYNPLKDSWKQLEDGLPRREGIGFVINNKLYAGIGYGTPDFWEYCPTLNIDTINIRKGFYVFPNPATGKVFIEYNIGDSVNYELFLFNSIGQVIKTNSGLTKELITIETSDLGNGVYFLKLIINNEIFEVRKLILN